MKHGRDVYESVDDGFALGLMAGEIFDLLDDRTIKEQVFVIE